MGLLFKNPQGLLSKTLQDLIFVEGMLEKQFEKSENVKRKRKNEEQGKPDQAREAR